MNDMYNTHLVPSTSMRGLCKIPAYSEYLANQAKIDGTNASEIEQATHDMGKERVAPSYNWGWWLGDYWEVPVRFARKIWRKKALC